MRYPLFLRPGGRVGFIAPSFGCTIEPYRSDFDDALTYFKNEGYETVLGPNCYLEDGIGISTTPEKCAAEANDFLINDRSDVIISCGGGELMCGILPFVDFAKIKDAPPKWFMGYSDNTNLTFTLNSLCDTASIYAPCASKFTCGKRHESVDDAMDILCGRKSHVSNYDKWYKEIHDGDDTESVPEDEIYVNDKTGDRFRIMPYKQFIYNGSSPADQVSISGRLVGGCLDCLVTLVGTEFDKAAEFAQRYKEDGIIWFLESCDLNVMSMRRALWQMENAGWFSNVKGFLIGRPLRFDDTFGEFDHYDAVLGILGKYNVPVIMDLDIGHQFPQMPIISGARVNVHAQLNSISMKFSLE